MKRINPLYLLGLLFFIAMYAAYAVHTQEVKLKDAQNEYRYKKELALKLKALKNAYAPKRKRELLRLLRSTKVRKNGVKFQDNKTRLQITGKKIDVKIARLILSKVLNSTYNIERFTIRKEKNGVDIDMEIVWQ